MTVTPGGEHPERAAEREDGILALLPLDLRARPRRAPRSNAPDSSASAAQEGNAPIGHLELDRGVVPPAHVAPQLQGNGEWLTGWSLPSAYRENRNGSRSVCGSPSTSFATSAPTPIIL